jgi:hypothetical protein
MFLGSFRFGFWLLGFIWDLVLLILDFLFSGGGGFYGSS